MQCRVTAAGRLADCVIIEETPPGLGFGEAMLKTARLFRMRPRTVDGHPVEGGTVVIPLTWRPHDFGAGLTVAPVRPRDDQWERRPTDAELAGLYPPEARAQKVGARTVVTCRVRGDAALTHCQLTSETPQGQGFGAAALKATKLFVLKPGVALDYDQPVIVTIRWRP
jgi:hypothetical protein